MEFKSSRGWVGKLLRGRQTEDPLAARARQLSGGVAAATRVRSGETRGSTRVETGHRSASGDRPAVRIVQDGAAVPEQFRQNRDYMQRGLAGGAGG